MHEHPLIPFVAFSMPEFQEKARVTGKDMFSDAVVCLSFRAPQTAGHARPGQFVMLRTGSGHDPLLRRPFSIYQTIGSETVQVVFRIVGQGTALLASLNPGDDIDCLGPLGRGFPLEIKGVPCLLGGGMGIAPLYFVARTLARYREDVEIIPVLIGAATGSELEMFADSFRLLGYRVLTATDDGSFGHHGFVPDLLPKVVAGTDQVYTCGPWPMMQRVVELCRQWNRPCFVSLEAHMACGLGACLGCSVEAAAGGYLHVCRQGPVFKADEVLWKR